MNKWLLALLGYTFFRLPGAVLGFFIGSFFKSGVSKISNKDFEINLLALASMVIKADGKVTQNELDFVRTYFVTWFSYSNISKH